MRAPCYPTRNTSPPVSIPAGTWKYPCITPTFKGAKLTPSHSSQFFSLTLRSIKQQLPAIMREFLIDLDSKNHFLQKQRWVFLTLSRVLSSRIGTRLCSRTFPGSFDMAALNLMNIWYCSEFLSLVHSYPKCLLWMLRMLERHCPSTASNKAPTEDHHLAWTWFRIDKIIAGKDRKSVSCLSLTLGGSRCYRRVFGTLVAGTYAVLSAWVRLKWLSSTGWYKYLHLSWLQLMTCSDVGWECSFWQLTLWLHTMGLSKDSLSHSRLLWANFLLSHIDDVYHN